VIDFLHLSTVNIQLDIQKLVAATIAITMTVPEPIVKAELDRSGSAITLIWLEMASRPFKWPSF